MIAPRKVLAVQLIASFNAWNDGAELEPSREWGELTIDANRPLAQAFLRGR